MSIDEADELFTRQGFWRRIFPQMIVLYVLFGGIGVLSGGVSNAWGTAVAALLVCSALTVALLYGYNRAAAQHVLLKQKHGRRYEQLLEQDRIRLSPMTILMSNPLGSSAERLLEQINHDQG